MTRRIVAQAELEPDGRARVTLMCGDVFWTSGRLLESYRIAAQENGYATCLRCTQTSDLNADLDWEVAT